MKKVWYLYDTFILIQAEDIQVDIHLGHPEGIQEDILMDIQTEWEPDILEDIQLSSVSAYWSKEFR